MFTSHVVTFHKCGSNWFRRLFREAAEINGFNIIVSRPNESAINKSVFTSSDSTLFLHRTSKSDAVNEFTDSDSPVFLCIRDPKDVLISQYWSWKATHTQNSRRILEARERLNALPLELGLRYLVENRMLPFCEAIESWRPQILAENVVLVKYEDLLEKFELVMPPVFSRANMILSSSEVLEIKEKYSFYNVTNRESGVENKNSHYRKGISGDWKNFFDPELSALFDEKYASVCSLIGYEPANPADDKRAGSGL